MLIPSFYPREGGAERQLRGLLPFLRAEGVQSVVVTRRLPGTLAREQIGGAEILRTGRNNYPLGFLFSSFVYLIAQRRNWDLVHVHTADSPSLLGATLRWMFRRPVVVKVTRSGSNASLAYNRRTWWRQVRLWYVSRFVDGFIILNQATRDELAALGVQAHRLFAIPNGVDVDWFRPASEARRRQLRAELGMPDVPTAIFAGRLIPRKRARLLVDVWPEIIRTMGNATLLIMGDGPEKDDLVAATEAAGLEDHVRFLGWCDQEEMLSYLQASDCCVLPSTSEGISNALLEAMAVGLAPVVSAVAGNLDVICDEKNGLVFHTPEELCTQLLRCFAEKELCIRLGVQARGTVVDRLSMAHTASQLAELYRHLLKS